ncbi:MAG: D-alanyl-D-alanine carboxypeptidase [Actinomycetota bacterium]|nr:D-alanyl-D-alanine carboxypeptidase [Actinomycetota bacterium]
MGASSAERSGPPPTPVPPMGSPSPFPQRLETPADAVASPRLDAPAAILADLDDGQIMFAKAPELRLPIASLTKIMTALIVLERLDLGHVIEVAPAAIFSDDDYGASSTLGLRAGERRTVRELLDALMLQSANDAALALAIDAGGTQQRFVDLMNERARTLGLRRTRFFSPNGLDDRGRSTVRDLLVLTLGAYAVPGFAEIVASRFREIPAPRGRPRRVQNRNALLWLYPGAVGVKTGFTAAAGYCLVATAERDGRRLLAVVLGERHEPFSEAAALLDHGFEGFEERTFVQAGQGIGTVAIRGGAVAVETSRSITALVPAAQLDDVRQRVVVRPSALFPPADGERVGTLKLTIPGVSLGASALVVAQVPLPPAAGDDPWWQRAAGAVGGAIGRALDGFAG